MKSNQRPDSSDRHATGDRHEQFEWTDEKPWSFWAEVVPKEFNYAMSAVAAVVDECVLTVSPESIHVKAVDPANVCLVEVTCECVNHADGVLSTGVDVAELAENVPGYFPNDGLGYRLHVYREEDGNGINVTHPSEGRRNSTAFDPESVRGTKDGWPEPDEGYEYDVTLQAPKVRGILGALAETDGDILRLTPSDGEILAESEDRNGDVVHEWRFTAPVTAGESQIYSCDYVSKVTDGLYPDGEVRMRFGDDQLLELSNGDLRYVIAPRIEARDQP